MSLPAKSPASRRWLISAAVILHVLLCVGGIILAFHWPFSAQNITQSIQEDWPGKITVRRFHRTYFPHPGCVLENVALTRGTTPSDTLLVAIQKITIAANYHDLLLRPGYVSTITLEGLKISIPSEKPQDQPKPQRASNSVNSSVRLGEVFTKDAVLEIAQEGDGPLRFEIHRLTLKSITNSSPMSYDLAMRNAQPPGEIRSQGRLGPLVLSISTASRCPVPTPLTRLTWEYSAESLERYPPRENFAVCWAKSKRREPPTRRILK